MGRKTRTTTEAFRVGGGRQHDLNKRYVFAGQVLAMRRGGVLSLLRPVHLDSASLVLDANGKWLADQRFYLYGESKRRDEASYPYPTDRLFTGMALDSYSNL